MTGFVLVDGIAHATRGLKPQAPFPDIIMVAQGELLWVHLGGRTYQLEYRDAVTHFGAAEARAGTMRAPMPGTVVAVVVAPGQAVKAGDAVMIIESMKLETVIRAPQDGEVAVVHFDVGDRFDRDAVLVSLVQPD